MIRKYFVPALMAAALLTGCQAPQGKFTPEQVAAMKSYGFTESNGDWSLGLSDSILFDKNDYRLRPDSRQQITTMVRGWRLPGSPIAALKAIPIIMVKIATMKPCRLSGPTAWPMPGRKALMSHAVI